MNTVFCLRLGMNKTSGDERSVIISKGYRRRIKISKSLDAVQEM